MARQAMAVVLVNAKKRFNAFRFNVVHALCCVFGLRLSAETIVQKKRSTMKLKKSKQRFSVGGTSSKVMGNGAKCGSVVQGSRAATSCATLLWRIQQGGKSAFTLLSADKSSSQPIPEGWRFDTKQKKDGSQVSHYFCPETGQHFYTYEDMMRYVTYAKEAGLPKYMPDFLARNRKKKNTGHTSESTDNHIEKSLDSGKGIDVEESLDAEEGTGIEKSSDSEEGTDTDSLDSEKTADAGDSDIPKNDPTVNISASEADILSSEDSFIAEQVPMQAIGHPAAVENPNPANGGPAARTIGPRNGDPMPRPGGPGGSRKRSRPRMI